MKLTSHVHGFAHSAPRAFARHALLALVLLTMLLGPATPALVSADVNPPRFLFSWGSEGTGDLEFKYPAGIAIDDSGNVYVADNENNCIKKFDLSGNHVDTFGEWGYGSGQFRSPFGIAVDADGYVYVCDRDNGRVQKLRGDGTFVTLFGSVGSEDGQFIAPMGVAVSNAGDVYVTDSGNDRVQKFTWDEVNEEYDFDLAWGTTGSGDLQFRSPRGIAVASNGDVYVVDCNNHRVQVIDEDGGVVTSWGTEGTGDGQLNYPFGIALAADGSVVVADEQNHRIQSFASDGTFLTKWGSEGTGEGEFEYPLDVATGPAGRVYVTDRYNHRVQVFGGPWHTFLGSGGYDVSDEARGVAVDSEGYVYVIGESGSTWTDATDPTPVRAFSGTSGTPDAFVARLFPDGRIDWYTFLGSEGFDQGYGVAVDNNGSVFVTGRSDASWSDAGTPVRGHSVSWDAFVAELDSDDGDLVWHTFLGGDGDDWGLDIAVNDGFLYVAGSTSAEWSETPRRGYSGNVDAFAAELEDDGDLVWHTFLGGNGAECNNYYVGVAVSDDGNAWITSASASGWSESAVVGHSGGSDAFVARLDSSGDRIWHTFMGSAQSDSGNDIAVDANGNAFVTGQSASSWGTGPVREHAGDQDGFAAKLDADGGLTWHTFIGGSSSDGCYGLQVDAGGNVYVAGASFADWGDPEQSHSPGTGWDVMAAKLFPTGGLVWHTFAGSSGGSSNAFALALNNEGLLHVAGHSTNSWGEPVRAYSTSIDGLVIQLAVPASTTVDINIALKAGWNMVSVPLTLDPESDSPADVFPGAVAVYTWNAVGKSYEVPDTIMPECGYWVAVTTDKTITVTGTPVTEWDSSLTTGWNMVGSVCGDPVDVNDLDDGSTGAIIRNAIYCWNPEGKSYGSATAIEEGMGYWVATTVDCTLTMTAPGPI